MNYIQHVNACLRASVEKAEGELVLFGQNLAAGSRIGGLGAGLGTDGMINEHEPKAVSDGRLYLA